MSAPPLVIELVERFRRNEDTYRSGQYNETQVRREFIDPFFECLGWDVHNRKGYAEAYKDVVHEDSLDVSGVKRAPDYCFRIGGARKFFLEAKKPSVNLRDDISPAYQLRRYAWTAKLPVSILTDFEEFAVYDGRVKPAPTDKAATARVMYLSYDKYPEQWDDIADVFSRDAILRGAFDKFADLDKGKRGTATVDQAFLAEIETWRDQLARNIALRNPQLDQRGLNDAVQRAIDRVIFLRLCEDRGIEDYGQLQRIAGAADIYDALKALFIQADYRYNSGLFHFESEKGRANPDTVSLDLTVDDKALKPILKSLYYPDSPYEFSVMPADILGQVYEQFLGKVIRLTPSHQAKVEEKPEVRKAGGVYYTPTYIVDYIVKHTVGALLDGKHPRDVDGAKKNAAPLRVLDPACGSGSFLIVAYQYLLDWFRDQYIAEGAEKHCKAKNPKLRRTGEHDYALTVPERKRILLDHIYGVDIDAQAVEVTKLSLLLKVIEGENAETLGQNRQLFHERALPDLDKNIKCGNSLIGPDYYTGQLEFGDAAKRAKETGTNPAFPSLSSHPSHPSHKSHNTPQQDASRPALPNLDTEELFRVNAFDWHAEFPFLAKDGGFDAVIGNPPYVRQESLGEFKDYFAAHYGVYHGAADLYTYFIEKGVSLLRPNGVFSYIVANKWMRANYGAPLRDWLAKQHIEELIDFGDLPVFKGATTYPCILRIRNASPAKTFRAATLDTRAALQEFQGLTANCGASPKANQQDPNVIRSLSLKFNTVSAKHLSGDAWTLVDDRARNLLDKIRNAGTPLGEYVGGKIYRGVLTGLNEAFVIDKEKRDELIAQDLNSAQLIKPFLAGRDIKRYCTPTSERYLILMPNGWTRQQTPTNHWAWLQKNYPAIAQHLANYTAAAQKRCDKGEFWWELRSCDYYDAFEKPKIMYGDIATRGQFTLDESGAYLANTAYILVSDSAYLVGLLNSRLMTFCLRGISSEIRGGYLRWIRQYVALLPIPLLDLSN
ncbi:MAG TPA: restriction endonuclease subunit R, partial [Candidatus Hydrogenedentes bacterium]|nr:restriction endonuclease subunit R [Candidatus Hydrogenedentota bacterium]